ncbi:MAG: Ldh family oxidoreductase [Magnetospirillum gryphiswaldense]|nr:Ldh family oxidoreductase [Magnetospirillum gryphiswaldense]
MSPTLILDPAILAEEMPLPLLARDVEPQAVEHVCQALLSTSLRGTDSHGINLYPHYCRVVDSGRINKRPVFTLHGERPAAAILDADHGFGHHAGHAAMTEAMTRAGANGIGAIAVANSSHFAAAAYYALVAAEQGMIGLSFTNADALVKATGAAQSFFGTNPICLAAPMADEAPFCLDMATSQVSWNKILNCRRNGQPLGEGWAFDGDGNPTVDADAARSLAPSGDYKGFGLGMMVEILCGLLAGGPVATELRAMYQDLPARRSISHFFMAIDIDAFVGRQVFSRRLSDMAASIRAMPALDPERPVMVPGDPEKTMLARRRQVGIPMDHSKFDEFLAVSPRFARAVRP